MDIIDILHQGLIGSIAVLFLSDATILFLRGKNNKARTTLAFILLLWGIAYLFRVFGFYSDLFSEQYTLFRPNVLITGSFYMTLTFLFPLQVLIPGWLNAKRLFLLFLPNIAVTGFYGATIKFLGQAPEQLPTYADFWASLCHFNVWYRFVILLCNVVYFALMLKWLYRYEKKYICWKNENFADQDRIDISWIKAYGILIILIFIHYLAVLAFGGKLTVICHSIVVIFSFSYLFYKGLFYESPYPDDFFRGNPEGSLEAKTAELAVMLNNGDMAVITDNSFEKKIPVYMAQFESWMAEEKPYLYKEFKLTDVSRILPLNRSYLSRVFNEGYGRNFSEIVRSYRVEYSQELIRRNPMMPIFKIADLSGFNSDSTFNRAFKQVTGITPNQFKQKLTI